MAERVEVSPTHPPNRNTLPFWVKCVVKLVMKGFRRMKEWVVVGLVESGE